LDSEAGYAPAKLIRTKWGQSIVMSLHYYALTPKRGAEFA
jgi:hypothetical protein